MTIPTQSLHDILVANESCRRDLIGQRFDVYEAIPSTFIDRDKSQMPNGWQSVGVKDKTCSGIVMHTTINIKGCTLIMWPEEIKKIGTLIIKSLK